MAKKGKQEMLFPEKDSVLAQACDKLIDARDEVERAKTDHANRVHEFIAEMRKVDKTSVKHNGRIFSISDREPKTVVTIKE